MLAVEVIEPPQSEWASSIVIALKKDGTPRFFIDYRLLDEVTIPDAYPTPRMDDCIDSLGASTIYTALDANWGYWQLPIAEDGREKATFVSHRGTFRCRRMPFGLRNVPTSLQRTLYIIISGVRFWTCLVYLDDVLILSKSVEDHIKHLYEVLQLLQDGDISIKLRKCSFFRKAVDCIGHALLPGRLTVA